MKHLRLWPLLAILLSGISHAQSTVPTKQVVHCGDKKGSYAILTPGKWLSCNDAFQPMWIVGLTDGDTKDLAIVYLPENLLVKQPFSVLPHTVTKICPKYIPGCLTLDVKDREKGQWIQIRLTGTER